MALRAITTSTTQVAAHQTEVLSFFLNCCTLLRRWLPHIGFPSHQAPGRPSRRRNNKTGRRSRKPMKSRLCIQVSSRLSRK